MRPPVGLLTRTATVLTAGATVDRYGDTIPDWSTATSRAVQCWAAQITTAENRDHRTAIRTVLRATFLVAAQLVAGERVVLDGITYDVDGDPLYAHTPTGVNHIEADLVEVTG